jgi:hypothetical protein
MFNTFSLAILILLLLCVTSPPRVARDSDVQLRPSSCFVSSFLFFRLWARPPPLYCVGTIPPLGFKVYPFSLLLLERYIYILLARNAIGFTVDWIRLVASGRCCKRICYTQHTI